MFAFLALAGLMGLFALTAAPSAEAQDGMTTIEYAENGKDPVVTLTATDPEDDMITWSVTGGADLGVFMIDEDGVLKFNTPPDYDFPADSNDDNTYVVIVTATDTDETPNTDTFTVTVKVTNVDEGGKVAWAISPDGTLTPSDVNGGDPIMQFEVGATLTASLTDDDVTLADKDVTVADGKWRWYRSSSKTSLGTLIDDETSASYTVTNDDVGMYIHTQVYYNVGSGREESASLASDYPVLMARASNKAPEFAQATVEREVDEGDKGMAVGAPVTATDDGSGKLNYALTGTDDDTKFKIDQETGQITTNVDLNYESAEATDDMDCETDAECSVTVTATDSAGLSSMVTVTIELKDVDEKPTFTTGPTTITRDEGMTALDDTSGDVTYMATDPEEAQVDLFLMGADKDLFRLDQGGVLSFRTKPDYEMPTDENGDNVYEVTVQAYDGTLYADRMVTINVNNVNEAPMVMGNKAIDHDENDTDPVDTLTAMDPEGDTFMWSLDTTGDDDDHFAIDEDDGMLKFSIGTNGDPADYEAPRGRDSSQTNTNTYVVGVIATDSAGNASEPFEVTVKVTQVDEDGEVTWTVDPDGDESLDEAEVNGGSPITQFEVGATLVATVTDGDVGGATKTVTSPTPRWQWHRSTSKRSLGTPIATQTTNEYTATLDDVNRYLHVKAYYNVGSGREESASLALRLPGAVGSYRQRGTRVRPGLSRQGSG